ncbi:MAG: molecular chaperone TorD family protein [Arcanobacterium sp.]|nr:molecular chaperone TorD family protein [Arcanobacterium sp.]
MSCRRHSFRRDGTGEWMISAEQLDRYAAAFTVLARLHLEPASSDTRHSVVELLPQWPILPVTTGAAEQVSTVHESAGGADPAAFTARGISLLRASVAAGETDSQVRSDQDQLYGISATALVAPFESVHLGDDHLVFDVQTLEVRAAYMRAGFQAPHLNTEPDDHIGLEIDFLGRCCLAALDALASNDLREAQEIFSQAQEFTRVHLAQWAPEMLKQAAAAAATQWVQGLEWLTAGAVAQWICDCDAVHIPVPPERQESERYE